MLAVIIAGCSRLTVWVIIILMPILVYGWLIEAVLLALLDLLWLLLARAAIDALLYITIDILEEFFTDHSNLI